MSRESRSASQILFGYLPDQTVDANGGVWKVDRWRNPVDEPNVDEQALANEVCRLATPWQNAQNDAGLVNDLFSRRARIKVKKLDRKQGIELSPFPPIWICKTCKRLQNDPSSQCAGGHGGRKGQFHFVGFCDRCGALRAPRLPKCSKHNQVKITFPGTSSSSEIVFSCPVCNDFLQRGFGSRYCDACGNQSLSFNVHRAASVYTPRSVVLVNAPSPERNQQIQAAGGAARALQWVLSGMANAFGESGARSPETLRQQFQAMGFPPETVAAMVEAARSTGSVSSGDADVRVADDLLAEAQSQAMSIALAMSEGRTTFENLERSMDADEPLGQRYRTSYREAIRAGKIHRLDFVDKFPVLSGQFGFTRGKPDPGASHLVAFREKGGDYIVYGETIQTEALFVQLAGVRVAEWLASLGHQLDEYDSETTARAAILRACSGVTHPDAVTIKEQVFQLVHSYAHRFIRLAAVHAGIERNSLSEFLVPLHLGFFVYAAAKGDFVLGGLQAAFETNLDTMLRDVVGGDHRCALDPGCSAGGAACVACLHLGEPSCHDFNTRLNRHLLSGQNGYLRHATA